MSRATGGERPADARHTSRKSAGEQPTAKKVANPRGNVRGKERRLPPRRAFQFKPGDAIPTGDSSVESIRPMGDVPARDNKPARGDVRGRERWPAPRRAFQFEPDAADISTDAIPTGNSSAESIRPMGDVPAIDNKSARGGVRGKERRLAPRLAFQSKPSAADIFGDTTPAGNNSPEDIRFMADVFANDTQSAKCNSYTDSIPAEELDAYMQNYANVALTQARTNARPSATEKPRLTPSQRR
jgi:hypothetical protein